MSDGAEIAVEIDNPAGNILKRYVRGDGMDELLVEYAGSGTSNRRFLSSDERGSIISVTDGSGTVLSINKYDEYGVPQSTNLGRFGYTGQAWLPEIGLWYYKARMYRPDIGRFLQTDPIGYDDSANLYAYVGNDPVNWIDPLGLQCVPCDVVVTASGPKVQKSSGTSGSTPAAGQRFIRSRNRDPRDPLGEDPCNAPLPDGSTINENVDQIRNMLRRGERLRSVGESFGGGSTFVIGTWVGLVQPGGRWDYKRLGGTEEQGNLNYGATGALLFPMDILLRGAGLVQEDPRGVLPGSPLDLPPSTYGDDPSDAEQIKEGARQCRGVGQ